MRKIPPMMTDSSSMSTASRRVDPVGNTLSTRAKRQVYSLLASRMRRFNSPAFSTVEVSWASQTNAKQVNHDANQCPGERNGSPRSRLPLAVTPVHAPSPAASP
eukprot:3556778-Pyramimonas_sp.AAC.1